VVGGEINRTAIDALRQQYDLERAKVTFTRAGRATISATSRAFRELLT
jgi:hypothetical protein